MDFIDVVLYLISVCVLTQLLFYALRSLKRSKPWNLPPGPGLLSIVRNFQHLKSKPHVFFSELAKVHGPLMSVQIGSVTTVVASSPSMAKEVLQTKDASFCGRSPFIAMTVLGHHENTIAFSPPNPHWRDLKKICKNYLFSRERLDATRGVRREQVQKLLSNVKDCCNVGTTVYLNFISNTYFSKDLADPKFNIATEFWELVTGTLYIAGIPNIADYSQLLKIVDPQGINRRTTACYKRGRKVFEDVIADRLESKAGMELNKEKDMLDVLLNAVKENKTEVKESELPNILLELIVGGFDTTSIILEWAMAELLHNQEKLKKAQDELEEVIGKGKPIEEDDIERLPYLQAIIKETLRLHPPVPFLVPRKAIMDVELSGYIVPKNTQVLVNIWSIGRDESLWKDPNVFEPERFLELKIDFKGRDVELLPFGAGRRMCPGIPIAQRMLHLILGSLLNSFNWVLEDGVNPENMNMDEKYGFTLSKAQCLRAVPILYQAAQNLHCLETI